MSLWSLPKEMYAEISRRLPYSYANGLIHAMAHNVIIKDVHDGIICMVMVFVIVLTIFRLFAMEMVVCLIHRVNDPAVYSVTCCIHYYHMGMRHREDDPVSIYNDNIVYYYKGMRHRIDGPAIIFPDGSYEYYQNGQLHRIDGPAIVCEDGHTAYYTLGKFVV